MDGHDCLHVILGAGGAIGTPLAAELLARGARVRTVSRSGRGPAGAEAARADLTRRDEVLGAVAEGSAVYLMAGLPYDRRVWRVQWPAIMENALAACEAKGARLLFFDNVYMYGPAAGPMTEQTANRPTSEKGKIRAEIAATLLEAAAAGRVKALIARAADFYGPFAERTSVASLLILQRLAAGKAAQVLVDADAQHSYTYTLDCARALPVLAADREAWGQVWHLPTARPAPTSREFVGITARELGVAPRLSVMPSWIVRALGVFSTTFREVGEMLYQNDRDYLFDSSKFEARYSFAPTGYEQGIRESVRALRERAGGRGSQA